MSQGLRDMLANRKFAIPLIVLLAFCFVGLILVGVVLILKPGAPDGDERVAEVTDAPTQEVTEQATSAPTATATSTPRPTPTLVPLGTSVDSDSGETPGASVGGDETPTTAATAEATATAGQAAEETPVPITDEELADTGIGWGLVLFAGVGLAGLAIVARRFRMAG
jgi:hypothetical protein